jgi:hypothetical protein
MALRGSITRDVLNPETAGQESYSVVTQRPQILASFVGKSLDHIAIEWFTDRDDENFSDVSSGH